MKQFISKYTRKEKNLWFFSLFAIISFVFLIIFILSACNIGTKSNIVNDSETIENQSDLSESKMMDTIDLISKEPRAINSGFSIEICNYLQQEFNSYLYNTVQQKFEYNNKQNELALRQSSNTSIYYSSTVKDGKIDGTGINLIANKHSQNKDAKTLIISAHYDTQDDSLGANDNASGVAVVMELSRLLKDKDFPFNIQFILFSGEEKWMLGSRWFLGQLTNDEKQKILGVINIDTIAESSDLGYQALIFGRDEYSTTNPMANPERFKNEISDLFTINNRFKLTNSINSDHYPFALSGIPAVSIVQNWEQGLNANSSNDTIEAIDSNRLSEIVLCITKAIETLTERYSS